MPEEQGISRISPRFPPTISIKKRFESAKAHFHTGHPINTKKINIKIQQLRKAQMNSEGSAFRALLVLCYTR